MEKRKTIFSPNPWAAIISYIVIMFIIASFITIFVGLIAAVAYDIEFFELFKCISTTDPSKLSEFSDDVIKANAITQGWGNFFGYLLTLVCVVFFCRDSVKDDLFDVKERKKFHLWYIPATAVGAFILSYLIGIFIGIFVDSSTNQITIEMILKKGGLIPMIFATILFAPIVEELIYRKAIFKICLNGERSGIILSYVASIVLFTLPHVLTSSMDNFGLWLLQCIPYAFSGFLLCLIYHKSKYNIYTSIAAHMFNNLVSVIMVVLKMYLGA